MFKLKIGQKSLLLFLIISLLPLVAINAYWLNSQQNILRNASAERQNLLTKSAAGQVDQFLNEKITTAILHSQTSSVQRLNLAQAQQELRAFIAQDNDIRRVALADINGEELVAVTHEGIDKQLKNVSESDAFRAATFFAGKEYVSGVTFGTEQQPRAVIAVPLVTFKTRQSLDKLSTAERGVIRNSDDIKGALIVETSLQNMWHDVLSRELGDQGYAYAVDNRGQLIAHPDTDFIRTQPDISNTEQVARFLKHPEKDSNPAVTTSERGMEVLSTHQVIPRTGWAVVAQEPLESILAPANRVAMLTLYIFLVAALISMLLSILFSRTLTKPIKELVAATSELARGNFSKRMPVNTADEIGVLGSRFNGMANNLEQVIGNLKTESAKLSIIIDNVGEAIVAVDYDNRIVLANIAASVLVGKLPKEIRGKDFGSIYHITKDNKSFEIPTNTTCLYRDMVMTDKDKGLRYLEVYVNEVGKDPHGIKNIIMIRDLTSEREFELMKLDFVSMAAHELRTPITAIRGYLALLESDKAIRSKSAKRSVNHALASTRQLVGLVTNLLNVSKIERGTLNMAYEKINWTDAVQEAVRDHKFTTEEKSIELLYQGPAEEVYVIADEISIREVINNLITNAIHYTPTDGHITVGVQVDGDQIITSVKDDGIGIPVNAQDRLFTKFYRVKGSLASGSGGTGLGLYISKSIIEMHKGKIWVESEEDKGSTFSFTLPVYDDVQYSKIEKNQKKGVIRKRGWITKNITR